MGGKKVELVVVLGSTWDELFEDLRAVFRKRCTGLGEYIVFHLVRLDDVFSAFLRLGRSRHCSAVG